MEEILEITVHCAEGIFVKGKNAGIAMVPFTGEASGRYFRGKILGTGTDTQRITPDGKCFLSARYMLEGEDYAGQPCRIFIENNGSDTKHCTPKIVTDSAALSFWEDAALSACVEGWEDGVKVHIYHLDES